MTGEQKQPADAVALTEGLGPLPEPAGFSAGTHDGALFTLKRSTGKNFAKGAAQPLCEWYSADQVRSAFEAGRLAEQERWREKLMAHRDRTVMSCYASVRECEAARAALQSVLDDRA